MTAVPICPSVDFDLDFDDTDGTAESCAHAMIDTFTRALADAPGRNDTPPVVNAVSDEEAVYLRGTIWLARYDQADAQAAADYVCSWADDHDLDVCVHY